MATKKRTSTKPRSTAPQSKCDDLDARIEATRQTTAKLDATKHWIFRQLFPSYRAAIARLEDPTAWLGNSDAMRQIRMQADEEWKALTGLPTLDAYNPDRWFMVAVAAGYSVREAKRMTLEELREIILPWALAKRATAPAAPVETEQMPPPPLEKDDVTILESLARRRGIVAYQQDITEVGRDRASDRLKYLASIGYVQNPPGRSKKGWTLTAAGMSRLAELPAVD